MWCGATLNWLLGVDELANRDPEKAALVDRFANAANLLSAHDVETCCDSGGGVGEAGLKSDKNQDLRVVLESQRPYCEPVRQIENKLDMIQ